MTKRLLRIFCALLLIALYSGLWYFTDFKAYFSLEALNYHQVLLQRYAQEHYATSVMLFIGLYTLHGALALPATSILIIAGGFLFGVIPGILYSLIASLTGGSTAFFATRSLFGQALHRKYKTQLASFKEQFDKNSVLYLLIMRIVPIIPFFLANILSGLALVPTYTFLWTLIVGVIPSLLIYTLLGTELSMAHTVYDLLSKKMVALYVIIALLTLLPLGIKKYVRRNSRSTNY